MTALFSPWANTTYRVVLGLIVLTAAGSLILLMLYVRTPYVDRERVPLTQPVEFDHRHHVRDDGIACLYCHPGAEREARAGLPPTDVCMGCHSQIWNDSPLLAPVRASYVERTPIAWNRVNSVPDFVYFHHGVHTSAGIDCRACHGRVEAMARVQRAAPLTMGWCLDCHRNPPGARGTGRAVTPITTCSACHR
jgi:hypothetical protein